MIDYTMNPNKNNKLVINDLTGVYSHIVFEFQHLNNNVSQSEPAYSMIINNIPDADLYNYTVQLQQHQYKDVIQHFPAVRYSLHHYQAVRSPSLHINYT